MRQAVSVGRENLHAVGTCFGKFTHSRKFHLKVTSLDVLNEHAKYKVWVKPSSEMSYLYGNHVLKAGVGRSECSGGQSSPAGYFTRSPSCVLASQ